MKKVKHDFEKISEHVDLVINEMVDKVTKHLQYLVDNKLEYVTVLLTDDDIINEKTDEAYENDRWKPIRIYGGRCKISEITNKAQAYRRRYEIRKPTLNDYCTWIH